MGEKSHKGWNMRDFKDVMFCMIIDYIICGYYHQQCDLVTFLLT